MSCWSERCEYGTCSSSTVRDAPGTVLELHAAAREVEDAARRARLLVEPAGQHHRVGRQRGARRDDGDEGDARMRLWEVLDGCLRLDEGERRTAKQMLEMPLFAEVCV